MEIILTVVGVTLLFALSLAFIKLVRSWYKRHDAEKEMSFHPTFYRNSESVISEQTERTDLTKKEDYMFPFEFINDSLDYEDEFSNINDDSEEGMYI